MDVDKTIATRGGGVGQILTWLTKGGGGFGEMLSLADKGGGGFWTPSPHFWLT